MAGTRDAAAGRVYVATGRVHVGRGLQTPPSGAGDSAYLAGRIRLVDGVSLQITHSLPPESRPQRSAGDRFQKGPKRPASIHPPSSAAGRRGRGECAREALEVGDGAQTGQLRASRISSEI